MNKTASKKEIAKDRTRQISRWILLIICAAAVGVICGAVGGAFARSIGFVTTLRADHPWLIYILPFGGLITVGLYKLTKKVLTKHFLCCIHINTLKRVTDVTSDTPSLE